ncbi:MAG: hypothetical protein SPJ42_04935 [Oscillospiraceae bacterium]|nr:hypothetical protein [Clostridiaceae bacterium]MDY5948573.1 hypothetical protein [Oscillospiraceae bacterium]
MISLGKLYVVFKRIAALVSAIMLLIVGADEKNLPEPDGAEITAKKTYVLFDYNVSSQGVTNDGKYFYFSGNSHLGKADMKSGEMIRVCIDAIPDALKEKGCNHIGGLSYYNGSVYAAIEDGPDYLNSFIALYDAETLEFTGKYYELPHELHLEGVPWCAIDVERGYLYTAEWKEEPEDKTGDFSVLNVFNLSDMSLVKTVPLSEPIYRIQGAEMFGGKLYMSCDELNDQKRVLSLDVETGKVETVFIRNIGTVFEAEDMTVYGDENGEPVFCVLDRGERRKSTNLTQYKLSK